MICGEYAMYVKGKCRCDDCRAANSAYMRAWRRQNPARDRAIAKKSRERNADAVKARQADWVRRNKDKHHAGTRRRRALVASAETFIVSAKDWHRLVERYRGCCAYCGRSGRMTMDHVVPLSRGGRHSIGNLLPACRTCNSSKRQRLLVEWRLIEMVWPPPPPEKPKVRLLRRVR